MLKQRVITALVLIPLLLGALFLVPRPIGAAVLAVLYIGGAIEWSGFFKARSVLARTMFALVVLAGMAGAYVFTETRLHCEVVLSASVLLWLLAVVWIVRYPMHISRLVVAACGFLLLIAAWIALVRLHLDWARGPEWLLYVFVLVWAADIGAYFAGRAMGRVKLAPRVSPGKTWEGVAGGLVAATLVAVAGSFWFGLDSRLFVPLSLLVAALSVVGDLTVSMFKRNADLKDSGWIFPGHGGILDRIDSITAAGPVFVLGLMLLGIGR